MLKEGESKYIGGVTITEEDRQFEKKINKESFTVRIPTNSERFVIANAISTAIQGAPVESIAPTEYEFIRMILTLCRVVKSGPSWWSSADQCPDTDLLNTLWRFYLEAHDSFASRLKRKANIK